MSRTAVGRFIPGDSIIYRLDPRIKLATNIIFIVLVFITNSFIMQGILVAPIFLAFFISGLKKKQLISMFKPVVFIGIFLFIINTFIVDSNNGSDWEYSWWSLRLNYEVVRSTLIIMLRIYIIIMITSLLTATTKPMALTKAIEDLLLPLKIIKVPVHIIAMIISIALRFIPTLLEETQRIMKAQASRGVDFKNGNIKTKAKSMVTLIIPLFVSAFAKAEDLGNAMETRGYDPYEKRTKYRSYPIKAKDIITALFIISIILLMALIRNDVIFVPAWWLA